MPRPCKTNAAAGGGGTADAIRKQVATSEPVGGRDYIHKGRERLIRSRGSSRRTRTIPTEPCLNGCETISLMLLEVFRSRESELNEGLLGSFPEIKSEFESYVSWQDGMETGAFLTYGDVFRSHVERALTTGDSVFHERTADFIENLFLTGDDYATSVVYVGGPRGAEGGLRQRKGPRVPQASHPQAVRGARILAGRRAAERRIAAGASRGGRELTNRFPR